MTVTKSVPRVLSHEVAGTLISFKVKDVGELILDMDKLSSEVKTQAMAHGLIQRVSDRAALSRDGGKSATPQEKFDAMKVLVEHYNSGSTAWNLTGGERGPSDEQRLLIEALSTIYPSKTKDELTAWVRKRSREELAGLTSHGPVKEKMDELRAQRAKGVDAEALLGELA